MTRGRGDAGTRKQTFRRVSPRLRVSASPRLYVGALLVALACTTSSAKIEKLEFWGLGREGEVVAELMPEFQRRNPGIRVQVQQIPWINAHEKLLTAYVGEATPDLAQMGNTWMPEFEMVGALEDLTPWVDRSSVVKRDDYFRGIWATNVIDARVYGVSWYVDTRLLFYRTDLLAAAGWPQPPKTWSEWVQTMKDVKERVRSVEYPILLPTNEFEQPIILAMQTGSPFLKDGNRYGAFEAPEFARAFEFYISLFRRGFAPPRSNTEVVNVYQPFGQGEFAMYITGPWNVGEFRRRLPENVQDKWMTAPLPAPDGNPFPGTSVAGGSSLVIFQNSRRKEAAWKLIEFLSEPEQQIRFFELTGNLPARRAAWNAPVFLRDRHMVAFRQQLENVVPVPKVPEWHHIATSVWEHAEAVIRGQMTTAEALADLDRKANQTLAKRRWVMERTRRRGDVETRG